MRTLDFLAVLREEGERDAMQKKKMNYRYALMSRAAAFTKGATLVLDELLTTSFPTLNARTLSYLLKESMVARY